MHKTREQVLELVREFHGRLAAIYGERLKGVYLYGSYARGEATEDSDIDVAVVLAGPVSRAEEDKRTDDLIGDLSLREDCILMPLFLSEEEYAEAPYAVFRSIVREGVGV
ncbi:MAG TPA: nucleotidyltransferase domain-containing protein [Planctomycetota bacterium]|nr:nucleotidyltransferase domain-containing protein [Planctomycetota bacterium]